MARNQDWEEDEKEESDEESWKKAHNEWKSGLGAADTGAEDALFHAEDCIPIWNEQEWETFIQRVDRTGHRIIAYYEKFWNHADRDRVVEEAMALYCIREAFRHFNPHTSRRNYIKYYLQPELKRMGLADLDYQDFFQAKEQALNRLNAYRQTRDFHRHSKYWILTLPESTRKEPPIQQLYQHSALAVTKFAAGHIMGYQPCTLGGHIALCKTALTQLNRSLDALIAVNHYGWLGEAKYLFLDELILEARNAVGFHIVELINTLSRHLEK